MVVVQATSETAFPYSDIMRKTGISLIMIMFLSDDNNKKYNSNLCYKIRKHTPRIFVILLWFISFNLFHFCL